MIINVPNVKCVIIMSPHNTIQIKCGIMFIKHGPITMQKVTFKNNFFFIKL